MCAGPTSNVTNLGSLTPKEMTALKALTLNNDVIIKTADNGGGIVIQNRSDYVREAERLLADSSSYRKLRSDPLPGYQKEINLLIDGAIQQNIINKNEASFLQRDFYRTPYFYHIPKIHKNQTNPPGRPIIAAIDSVTSGLSKYIDHHLQPLAQGLQSYIRDGTHLLDLLKSYRWENRYTWISLDVNSLYTSIPHTFGLTALSHFLSEDPYMSNGQASFILDCARYCLTHNYFVFDDQYYLQVQGTAMGANFAPSYANLAMGLWKHRYIWHNNPYHKHLIFYG